MAEEPIANIKDYIVQCRQGNMPDSKIVEGLRKSNWPDDVINAALVDANSVILAVPEPKPEEQEEKKEENKEQKKDNKKPEKKENKSKEKKQDENAIVEESMKKEKKPFSFLAIFALLLSPVPFVGLGVAMNALDNIRKNKMSGGFLAVLALLINIGTIMILIYLIYQIFTLPPESLQGFSKAVNDMFNLV